MGCTRDDLFLFFFLFPHKLKGRQRKERCPHPLMASFIGLPSATVKIDKPETFVETEEQPVSSIPVELTASTALQLWYGNMQTAIMEGLPLGDVDTLGYNFLHYACLEGNSEVVDMLLEQQVHVDIESQNHQRIRPLHWAALRGHTRLAVRLIGVGAQVDSPDSEGHTPLMKAVQYGQLNTCQTLIAYGASIHAQDAHGHQALHWACYMGRSMVVELLIRNNADIHFKDGELRTPLHRAVQQSHSLHHQIAILLLGKGAEVEIGDDTARNNMIKMAKDSRGQAQRSIVDLLISSQRESWAPLLFGKKPGTKGDFFYHKSMCEARGKFPSFIAIFLGAVCNSFVVYYRHMALWLGVWTRMHYVGLLAASLSVVLYLTLLKMDPGQLRCRR